MQRIIAALFLCAALVSGSIWSLRVVERTMDEIALTVEAGQLEQAYAQQQETQLAAGIEEELASYIEDKARQLGLDCQVSVTTAVGEDGVPLPRSITVTGAYSEALCQIIETDLGIPQENQNWQEAS